MWFCTYLPNFIRIGRSARVMTLCRFSQMAAIWRPYHRKSTSAFLFFWRITFKNVKNYLHTKFRPAISIHGILLLPVAENIRLPYWNSTAGFNFDLFTVISIWFCTGLPNFIRIKRSATELWRYIDFPRWRPYRRKFTSVFRYGYAHASEGTKLFDHQISTKYLNLWLRY